VRRGSEFSFEKVAKKKTKQNTGENYYCHLASETKRLVVHTDG